MVRETGLKIGGACGFWGDASRSTGQLLAVEHIDYIVYDYLAEVTMSILARARVKDSTKGYATDFLTESMRPNLGEIASKSVKIISNAGGVNPIACAEALESMIRDLGLNLKVACITGDDLLESASIFFEGGVTELFSGAPFPALEKITSINAYIGAFPIAKALDAGADIVITGRCVDSAVTLGACIHEFGWGRNDFDNLAMGSLAGHILECGPQATGGNYTDWEGVGALEEIGYPIAEISSDGSFIVTKPDSTGGMVTAGTVSEQMLYEIGDPQAYILPDVICDFSQVEVTHAAKNRVRVTGALGQPAPDSYKVSVTYSDEYRGGTYLTFYGLDASRKAKHLGDAILRASRNSLKIRGMPDFSASNIEILGTESQFGKHSSSDANREVVLKIAAIHSEEQGISLLLKEAVGLGLATPPGLSGFAGTRPRPSPIVRLFSFAVERSKLQILIHLDGDTMVCEDRYGHDFDHSALQRPKPPQHDSEEQLHDVPLIRLAVGRSGDKGDKANIGIIARKPEYLPWIYRALNEAAVADRFSHFLKDPSPASVERFYLPGTNAINLVLHNVLDGGGTSSLRNDPQGKGYAQLLLGATIPVPASLAEVHL